MLCCTSAVLQGCRTATTHRCSCNDEQGCCHLATDSSSAAEGMHRFVGMVAVLHFCSSAGLYELQNLLGVVAVTSKAVATLPLTAVVLQRDAQVSGHGCCCTSACRTGATHNCSCSDKQGCCHLATDSSNAAEGMHRSLGEVAVLHFCRGL